jgi:ABC-type transport system involved in multi-copper enzyme maturation permease subunit
MTATAEVMRPARRSAFREFLAGVGTIMVKELRSRMRGRRAFVVLTIYLGLLALITYGSYLIAAPTARDNFGVGGVVNQANTSAIVGQTIFTLLSIFQLILICFIAPGFTAGQISLEREKQTLDLLVSTPMRPGAIVVGKLLAALAFVVLMIVAAVPITAIVLMYGGASVDDIVRQQLVLLATAVALGAVGLFFSALLKRTQAATVLSYITMLALTLGTIMLFGFWTLLINQDNDFGIGPPRRAPEQLLYVNPGIAMLDVVGNTEPGGFGGINAALAQLRGEVPAFGGAEPGIPEPGIAEDELGNPVQQPFDTASGYWWPRIALTFIALAALLTFLSTRFVVPAGMRWAFRRRQAAPSPNPIGVGPPSDPGHATLEEIEETER